MNDVYIILLFTINNILWGFFVYIFTPRTQKEKITLPKVKLPEFTKKESDGSEFVDVDEAPSAVEILKGMGINSNPEEKHHAS